MAVYTGQAQRLLSFQLQDGSWGKFHSLGVPMKAEPYTTEQAIRRLSVLGYSIEDAPIQKAVDYMHRCLKGEAFIRDRREKTHDWDIFTNLILATWIRRFTKQDELANAIAKAWCGVITSAFQSGRYSQGDYEQAYIMAFSKPVKGDRFIDFVTFYQVSLAADGLDEKTEPLVFEYILRHPKGIYYIYPAAVSTLPEHFHSKMASRYLYAVEMLADYTRCKDRLGFVTEWLYRNQTADGLWDMGSEAKDGVYFPTSDSWCRREDRISDCTHRIQQLLNKINT